MSTVKENQLVLACHGPISHHIFGTQSFSGWTVLPHEAYVSRSGATQFHWLIKNGSGAEGLHQLTFAFAVQNGRTQDAGISFESIPGMFCSHGNRIHATGKVASLGFLSKATGLRWLDIREAVKGTAPRFSLEWVEKFFYDYNDRVVEKPTLETVWMKYSLSARTRTCPECGYEYVWGSSLDISTPLSKFSATELEAVAMFQEALAMMTGFQEKWDREYSNASRIHEERQRFSKLSLEEMRAETALNVKKILDSFKKG